VFLDAEDQLLVPRSRARGEGQLHRFLVVVKRVAEAALFLVLAPSPVVRQEPEERSARRVRKNLNGIGGNGRYEGRREKGIYTDKKVDRNGRAVGGRQRIMLQCFLPVAELHRANERM
jgi:hypothetical protein